MEFDYSNGKQTPRGYVARNTIEVRVDDLAKVGDVLDAAVGSGATTIHGLRFDVKAREAIERRRCRRRSATRWRKPRRSPSGAKRAIDRVIRIEEVVRGGGGPQPMMERAG